jgi:branched-chain amino acid transport system substrate-binding protein
MQSSIAELFAKCRRNDLVLLYFTGHGITDQNGHFFFPTRETRKLKDSSNFNPGLAVSASFVRDDVMHRCLSQRQVIILDCCFSGAFLTGTHRMGNQVDMKAELGGEGRAILTAANARGFALELEGEDLSAYTRYLVKGLETGAAAPGDQELIRAEDLSKYIREQLRSSDVTASMSPGSHPADDGDEIVIARVAPVRRYRNMVLEYLQNGQISPIRQATLKAKAEKWGISPETETEILEELSPRTPPSLPAPPSRKLDEYAEVVRQEVDRCNPLSERTSEELRDYQKALDLRDEDVAPIHDLLRPTFFTPPDTVESIVPDVEPIVVSPIAEPVEQLPPDEPLDVSGTQDLEYSQSRRNFPNWILLSLGIVCFIGMVGFVYSRLPVNKPPGNTFPSPSNVQSLISAGDNTALTGSRSHSNNFDKDSKERIGDAIKDFKNGSYELSRNKFKRIRDDARGKTDGDKSPLKDPEILIFQNNAEARRRASLRGGSPIYKIAAVVPLSDSRGEPFYVGQQMLFGIAQAQAKAIETEKINLEVVIANDENDPLQVEELAKELVKPAYEIVAIIGHYSSANTCKALPIYNAARLAVISPTSTKTDMRAACGKADVFFRTTSSSAKEIEALVKYLTQTINQAEGSGEKKRIAVFYTEDDPFSQDMLRSFKSSLVPKFEITDFNLKDEKAVSQYEGNAKKFSALTLFPDGHVGGNETFEKAEKIIKLNVRNIPILAANSLYSSSVAAGSSENSPVIAVDWAKGCGSKQSFINATKDTWEGPPNRIVASSYESVQVLFSHLSGTPTREAILNGLQNHQTKPESDVFEEKKISFTPDGDRSEIENRILVRPTRNQSGQFEVIQGQTICEKRN